MRDIDELRPLTAGRLLELWKASREIEDPLERVLVCNVRILMECCRFQGERVYGGEQEALADLTGQEIDRLLRRLAEGGGSLGCRPQEDAPVENPEFDAARFEALRRE